MPTNTNEADIAVLKAEMRDTREDMREIRKTISDSARDQKETLKGAVSDLTALFEKHDRNCDEYKRHESEARKGIYERLSAAERELATVNVRFDLKRDWLKLIIALASVIIAGIGLFLAWQQ